MTIRREAMTHEDEALCEALIRDHIYLPGGGSVRRKAAARIRELAAMLEKQTDYSIKLQRIVEALRRGDDELPHKGLHIHDLAVTVKADRDRLRNALLSAPEPARLLVRGRMPFPSDEVEREADPAYSQWHRTVRAKALGDV